MAGKIRAVLLKATPDGSETELDDGDVILNMARTGSTYYVLLGPNDAQAAPMPITGGDPDANGGGFAEPSPPNDAATDESDSGESDEA